MLVLALILLAATPAADAPPMAKPICRQATVTPAAGSATATVLPLGHEPNATQVLAVLRTEGGCITPVIVRDSVGITPRR